ncbi:MAG: hypothetical protein IKW18_06195 [Clostridia bacterium]|nr:hypothetical protein [Clostridia bacterium]
MNGGYVLIDCKGLDLTDTDPQTISGLYAQMQAGIKTGKPLVACNCVWGSNSDSPMTPINFFAQQWSEDLVVGTASILNISCTSGDVVTVTSLVS